VAASKTYLVPVDFSKGSEAALRFAVGLAKKDRSKLIILHVVSAVFAFPLEAGFGDIIERIEQDARQALAKFTKRLRLKPGAFRLLLIRAVEPASAIADQAKKSHAAMIIMGSHGRTGLQRLMIGSVAERTLRYAHCPVLIVKK